MLKILIAEDDPASKKFLSKFLSQYGECDIVVDGLEAVDAYMLSMRERQPYDLICLDIMMPKIDGLKVMKAIRKLETLKGIPNEKRVKIIMITAMGKTEISLTDFNYGCEAYVSKPIDTELFIKELKNLGLVE